MRRSVYHDLLRRTFWFVFGLALLMMLAMYYQSSGPIPFRAVP
jgi:hypothetical protein